MTSLLPKLKIEMKGNTIKFMETETVNMEITVRSVHKNNFISLSAFLWSPDKNRRLPSESAVFFTSLVCFCYIHRMCLFRRFFLMFFCRFFRNVSCLFLSIRFRQEKNVFLFWSRCKNREIFETNQKLKCLYNI